MTVTSLAAASRSGRQVFANESRVALQPLRLALATRSLIRHTTRPSTVIVLPGFGGGDSSTIPLRWYLQRIGHHVEGWELGIHGPQVMNTLKRFTRHLEQKVEATGKQSPWWVGASGA